MNQAGSSIGLVLVLAVAGGAAGGALSAYLLRTEAPRERAADRGYDDRELRAEIRDLRELVQRTRRVDAAADVAPPESGDGAEASAIEVAGPDSEKPAADAGAANITPGAYVEALRGKRFTVRKSDQLIGYLSMHKEEIEPMIAALEKAIAADPSNPDLYTALASAHVSKLAARLADGPAAGPVYAKAIQAYDKAIELNPEHWDARYYKAFTTSMAPEVVGLRPMSIRLFEDLVRRQDALPKQDDFRRTYMRLGTLYKDAGNTEKAKALWTRGLERFPDDKAIRAALDVLEEK